MQFANCNLLVINNLYSFIHFMFKYISLFINFFNLYADEDKNIISKRLVIREYSGYFFTNSHKHVFCVR